MKNCKLPKWHIDKHFLFPYLRAKLKTLKIMFSEKDFERQCFLYKTEGEPKGVSINSFCISNNIPYTACYDWFKKTQKKIVPVEVEGIPQELIQIGNEQQDVVKDNPKCPSPNKGSIMVTIRTREVLCIQKKGLDYLGLKTLVESKNSILLFFRDCLININLSRF